MVLMMRSDSYKEQATEVFILQMTAKNLLFYGFSTFVNSWVAADGPAKIFEVYGIVSLCIVATCIPMCELKLLLSLIQHQY